MAIAIVGCSEAPNNSNLIAPERPHLAKPQSSSSTDNTILQALVNWVADADRMLSILPEEIPSSSTSLVQLANIEGESNGSATLYRVYKASSWGSWWYDHMASTNPSEGAGLGYFNEGKQDCRQFNLGIVVGRFTIYKPLGFRT